MGRGPNYDAGGEVDTIFDRDSLIELNALLDSEIEAQKKAIKETDYLQKRAILEQSGLRQKALKDAYEEEVGNLKRAAQVRINIEKDVYSQLIRIGGIADQTKLDELKKKEGAHLAEKIKAEIKATKELNDGKITPEETKAIAAKYKLIWKKEEDILNKKYKKDQKLGDKLRRAASYRASKDLAKEISGGIFGSGKTLAERKAALKSAFTNPDGSFNAKAGFINLTNALSDLAKQLENQIDTIGGHKSTIDTRLQGSKNTQRAGSYWDYMSRDITGLAGVSPYIKQEAVVSNLESFVKRGIAYNVEQRAFLQTISEKIANTFDAADSTLLRLVRIQQQDTTASRLGMESALNAFLNNMYETSEYLSDLASGVRSSLEEAQALMGAAQANELEWQVQKWLGSLYSVGMSNKGVSSIADAFGKIIAGDISGLTGGGAGNLIIMSANQAGLSIADILADGLDATGTNKLLAAMVDYLKGIYNSATDSRVVQQQIASVYGLTASDLKALTNIASSDLMNIGNKSLTYSDMINRLYDMAGSMGARTGVGEMMDNVWKNFQYTLAAGVANNPALYATYKIAGLLDSAVGGLPLPFINTYFGGIDLHTSVADLMRVAAMSGSIMSGVGTMLSNLSAGGGFSGKGMLNALGISGLSSVSRGSGNVVSGSGTTLSESGFTYVGNSDSSAVKDKTMADANADAQNQLVAAQESEDQDIERKVVNESVLSIYNLLSSVISNGAIKIKDTTFSETGRVGNGGWN